MLRSSRRPRPTVRSDKETMPRISKSTIEDVVRIAEREGLEASVVEWAILSAKIHQHDREALRVYVSKGEVEYERDDNIRATTWGWILSEVIQGIAESEAPTECYTTMLDTIHRGCAAARRRCDAVMDELGQSPGPCPEEVIVDQVETSVRAASAIRAERVGLLETVLDSLGSILQGWREAEGDERCEEPAEGQDTGAGEVGGRAEVRRRDRSGPEVTPGRSS